MSSRESLIGSIGYRIPVDMKIYISLDFHVGEEKVKSFDLKRKEF
jgi:hypothetical protein